MKQCLKISFSLSKKNEQILPSLIQREARKLNLEGAAQVIDHQQVQIVACGSREAVEKLVDAIYKAHASEKALGVEVEPFIKDRDFRGVFRVID